MFRILYKEDQIAQRKSKLTKKSSCEKVSNYNILGAFIWNIFSELVKSFICQSNRLKHVKLKGNKTESIIIPYHVMADEIDEALKK